MQRVKLSLYEQIDDKKLPLSDIVNEKIITKIRLKFKDKRVERVPSHRSWWDS